MKHKTVDANFLVSMHTNFINEVLFVTESAERRQKPAIAAESLAHIGRSCTFLIKDRIVEYILQ